MKKIIITLLIIFSNLLVFGQVGIATSTPTELLDLAGFSTLGKGGLKIRNINTDPYKGSVKTDRVVMASSDGTLKTVDPKDLTSTSGGGNIDIEVGKTVFYVRKMQITPATLLLSDVHSDVLVINGLTINIKNGTTGSNALYYPRFDNRTSLPIKFHFSAIASVNQNVSGANTTLQPGSFINVDSDGIVYGGSTRFETETADVFFVDGKWYRVYWSSFIDNMNSNERVVHISVSRFS